MAGNFRSNQELELSDIVLPELGRNISLPTLKTHIFNADCRYDLILGRDALRALRIHLDFESNRIMNPYHSIPMQTFPSCAPDDLNNLAENMMLDHMDPYLADDDDSFANDDARKPLPASEDEETAPLSDCSSIDSDTPEHDSSPQDTYATSSEILPSSYEAADLNKVVRSCTHLSQDQQNQLYDVLSRYPKLFDGNLRCYTEEKIHLDVDPSIPPHRSRAYPIPRSQLQLFKDELDRLVKIGVLEEAGRSEWISGTFIIPKKDNRIRWISDFRALNKALKRKVYPIPRIQDILDRRTGYKFLSKLDLSMQYYTFKLDDDSKELCTIATPYGLYRYCRLPMGISQSPDIAQEIMERVLRAIADIEVYLNDIACFSNDFSSHMILLDTVFQ